MLNDEKEKNLKTFLGNSKFIIPKTSRKSFLFNEKQNNFQIDMEKGVRRKILKNSVLKQYF